MGAEFSDARAADYREIDERAAESGTTVLD
jgi:hypothetical protein